MNTKLHSLTLEVDRLARYRTSHVLHLLLSVITVGMWVPVWLLVGVNNAIERGRCERRIRKLEGK